MPTYEYQCGDCGHRFETFQSIKEPALTTCPQCHHEAVHRLISSGTGLIFKGSGYYLTDYKSAPSKQKQSGDKSKKTKSEKPKKQD
ncbi:MAG: zinc ribbon domain-containing protein [FCB group bacterium]|nr:zinc ribbon domain-containing protein [FCB group bacterium]